MSFPEPIYLKNMKPNHQYILRKYSPKPYVKGEELSVTFTGEISEKNEYVMYSPNDGPELIKLDTYKVIVNNEEKNELWVNEKWYTLIYW